NLISHQFSTLPLIRLAKSAFHFILPPRCLACDELVAEQGGLCATCWQEMPFIESPFCDRTGKPMAFDLKDTIVSAEALANPPIYRKMRAPTRYEGTARRMILSFKFHDRLDLTPHLARLMVRSGTDLLNEADIIIPVPLHRKRLFSRRFNQSAELAKEISTLTGIPCALEGLQRIRPTKQQTTLDMAARHKNVEGAFRVPASEVINVQGRRIILIDDVVTTGATINACTRALLREKASHIDILTFAKVVEQGDITL
ncbi:MAG: ComF family protein, partial [Hyphomicrobiales bacterium]